MNVGLVIVSLAYIWWGLLVEKGQILEKNQGQIESLQILSRKLASESSPLLLSQKNSFDAKDYRFEETYCSTYKGAQNVWVFLQEQVFYYWENVRQREDLKFSDAMSGNFNIKNDKFYFSSYQYHDQYTVYGSGSYLKPHESHIIKSFIFRDIHFNKDYCRI